MTLKEGDDCTRCDGTGSVYDEGPEAYGWGICPYFSLTLNLRCLDGVLVKDST